MIPGINLLAIASSVIATQSVTYLKWLSRTRTQAGQLVDTYSAPITIRGSWQPVNMVTIKNLGLDMSKQYRQLWTNAEIKLVDVDRGADKIIIDGYEWTPANAGNDWSSVDGWRAVVFVRSKPE